MNTAKLKSLTLLLGVLAGVAAAPLYAQQATDASKSAQAAETPKPAEETANADADVSATAALIAKANAAAAAASAGKPSVKTDDEAAMAKKAKAFGWRPENQHGKTVYCREDAEVGSRFSTKRCVGDTQLVQLIEQAQADKDQLKQRGCGGNCGSSK